MADVLEEAPLTDAAAALALGKRHLLVRDYNSAVNTLIQACELLVQKHGDGADELAEPYLLYGRALLNLAREESNVLGSAVPCDEKDSDEDAEVDGEDEDEGDGDEEMDVTEEKRESDQKKAGDVKTGGEVAAADQSASKEGRRAEEKKPTELKKDEAAATPGSSKMVNGGSSSHMNGDVRENGEDDEEVNDDEDADNLEVAWEVLELAKLVLLKRGPPGWHLLSEAHKLLGEVAMEGGNVSGALTDFHACLDLLQKIEPCNPRAIAEIYYQLGLAYSFANDFDSSIEQFKEAGALLEARIKELEETTTGSESAKSAASDDPFYSVEGEIKELKELLPEIEEKISDMKDAKQEACRLIIEGIREKASAGGCSNGASTSNGPSSSAAFGSTSSSSAFGTSSSSAAAAAAASSSASSAFGTCSGSSNSKPVTDISHLIRKKRKPEESPADEASASSSSPCKKLSPQ